MEQDLRTMPLAAALDVAGQLQTLKDSPGWAVLQGLLAEKTERLTAQLLNPSLPSYEKLAALTAEIRGLTAVEKHLNESIELVQAREHEAKSRLENL
jgi:hypothetical protein